MQTEAAVYERIVLKLRRRGASRRWRAENISPQVVLAIAERIKEVRDLGVQIGVVIGGGNIWREPRPLIAGWIATTADLHGNARDSDQWSGVARRLRPDWGRDEGADRDRNEKRGGAIHPWSRRSSSRAWPRCHFRRRHRQPLFFYRYHCRAPAPARDRRAGDFESDQSRWRLRFRSPKTRNAKRYDQVSYTGSAEQAVASDGFDCFQSMHGQQNPDCHFST